MKKKTAHQLQEWHEVVWQSELLTDADMDRWPYDGDAWHHPEWSIEERRKYELEEKWHTLKLKWLETIGSQKVVATTLGILAGLIGVIVYFKYAADPDAVNAVMAALIPNIPVIAFMWLRTQSKREFMRTPAFNEILLTKNGVGKKRRQAALTGKGPYVPPKAGANEAMLNEEGD